MKADETIISIKHLSKRFRVHGGLTLYALDDVNLDVRRGETLGVIGESGCGKSTLGKCIVRLHEPTSGSITFEGEDMSARRGAQLKEMRKHIQMIFQDAFLSLNPRKMAGWLVEEPLIIHGVVKDKAERERRVLGLMREVGLDSQHVYRYPHEFSGGQRQRLNIARALSLNPRVIVCDEPVSALDVSIQAQVLNLFMRLQKEYGLTYIFISHDLSVVRHVSDRIAIMYLGRIVELCDAQDVYTKPLHPYTQMLLSAIPPSSPIEKKERPALRGEVPGAIDRPKGCVLASRCPQCMEICRTQPPKLLNVDLRHDVACFLYQQI